MVRLSFAALAIPTLALCLVSLSGHAQDDPQPTEAAPAARIDGTGPDWKPLGKVDFVNVNCDENTWTFPEGEIHCTGSPVGVMRTTMELANFELVVEWRHLKSAGNSGVFLWASEESLSALKRNGLPAGIEVQILDHGYAENYRARSRTGLPRMATYFLLETQT